jgi:hypothetical protein
VFDFLTQEDVMSKEKEVGRHVFVFNPKDNGGESLMLITDYFDNGDDNKFLFTNQELTLQSYCNSATLQLMGANLTPAVLRQLANELESKQIQIEAECSQRKNQGGADR